MSHYNQFVTSRLDFDNAYSISFNPSTGGTIYATAQYKGNSIDIARFMTTPGSNDGYFAFMNPEDFVEVLYRVSKAVPPNA